LGTYIKRRSNLVFVCDKAEDIDTTELRLSLFESAESLRLSDMRCAVQIADTAKIPPASAVAIYDAFEAIIEATLPGSFSAPSIRRRAGGCAAAFNAPMHPLHCPACRRCSLNGMRTDFCISQCFRQKEAAYDFPNLPQRCQGRL
jgi:hypothetical protein